MTTPKSQTVTPTHYLEHHNTKGDKMKHKPNEEPVTVADAIVIIITELDWHLDLTLLLPEQKKALDILYNFLDFYQYEYKKVDYE